MTIGDRNALDLVFAGAGGRTVVTRRRYRWPLLIGRVFADPARPLQGLVTIQNAAGTIIPGDCIRARIGVVDGGTAVVHAQGATVVSGVNGGAVAVEDTRVSVDSTSRLLLDPSPRILMPHARYRQHTAICAEPGGRAIFVDTLVLHPSLTENGFGSYESSIAVTTRDGRLLAVDSQRLAALPRVRRAPNAFGTVYLVGTGLDTVMTALTPDLEALSVLTGADRAYVAVTDLPNEAGWAVRLAASDGKILRSTTAAITELVGTATDHIRANLAIAKQ